MEEMFSKLLDSFDLAYMLAVNVLSFVIINLVGKGRETAVKCWVKRSITAGCGVVVGVIAALLWKEELHVLFYSYIMSLVSWDMVFSPMLKKIGINYNGGTGA